jgi:uncharacterized protein YoaH (UPF0181 family)
MARITYVKSARKDQGTCQKCGKPISAGDPYKWVAIRPTPRSSRKYKRCASCPNWKPSELSSSKLAAIYAVQEDFEEYNFETFEDIQSFMESAGDAIRDVAEEYRESAQNIEDGFGHETYVSQELADKADTLEGWADDVAAWYGEEWDEDSIELICSGCGNPLVRDDEGNYHHDPELDDDTADETPAELDESCPPVPTEDPDEARERWLEEQLDDARSVLGEIPI